MIRPSLAISMILFTSGVLDWSLTETMTSKLFCSFLVLALAAEASSGTTSSCVIRNCVVSSWSSWSACSQPCGTGAEQVRTRTATANSSCCGSPCPVLEETQFCNQGKCANGGTPNFKGCNCRQEFSGQCCTQTEGKHHQLFNNYSPKAKWILSNNPRVEVEGIIRQYSLSLRGIIVLV